VKGHVGGDAARTRRIGFKVREPAGRDRTTKGTALVLRAFKAALKDDYKDAYDCPERVR
jgi:hypothetical protein